METWIQNYTAVGDSLLLTAAAALLPIIFFFVALTILKMKGYVAGFFTLLISILVAIFAYGIGRYNQRPHGHGTAPGRNHVHGLIL